MTGSITTKKGRPHYYIVLNYLDENGKRKRPTINTYIPIKGGNKRAAKEKLKEVLFEYEFQKLDFSRKDEMFVDFMKEWLDNLQFSIEPTTYDGYKLILERKVIPFFQPKRLKLKDVTPEHIQMFVRYHIESVSANTVRKYLTNISKCFDSAVRQNIIAFNPVKRIDLPKKQKYTGAKFYNERLIEQLLTISKGDPLEIVILLAVFYGLRRSECLGIKWSAIDFENGTIAIKHTVVNSSREYRKDSTKNNSSNTVIPLAKGIANRLEAWRAEQAYHKHLQPNDYIDEGYVCTQFDGSLIKPNYVSQHFKKLLARNGMPHIRFHDLRHSSAGYLKYLGFDLKDIQTWLRHGDIGTTMNIYVNLDMTAKTKIADRLDACIASFGV